MLHIDDAAVNELVSKFQQGDSEAFDDLFRLTTPFIKQAAQNAAAQSGIPSAEFESVFTETLWRCAQTWDQRSSFMQRLATFIRTRGIDVLRSYTAKKNEGINYKPLSLDRPMDTKDSESSTFLDMLTDDSADILPNMIEAQLQGEAADLFRRFSERNPKYAKAIYARIVLELEGDRLANALGYGSYDTNARKLVSRSIEAFRKFALEHMAA